MSEAGIKLRSMDAKKQNKKQILGEEPEVDCVRIVIRDQRDIKISM